jgi:hypothetical protein
MYTHRAKDSCHVMVKTIGGAFFIMSFVMSALVVNTLKH